MNSENCWYLFYCYVIASYVVSPFLMYHIIKNYNKETLFDDDDKLSIGIAYIGSPWFCLYMIPAVVVYETGSLFARLFKKGV